MKIGVKVGDIMTQDYVYVSPETSIKNCAKIMIAKHVGSLVIQEDKKLRGLITERDIIWAMTKKSINELELIQAKNIAKTKIEVIKPSADLYEALIRMKKSKYRWLPVMVKGEVVGLLTLKDILRIEPGLFEIAHSQGIFQIKGEKEKLKRKSIRKERGITEGECEECGNFTSLQLIDNRLICEICMEKM